LPVGGGNTEFEELLTAINWDYLIMAIMVALTIILLVRKLKAIKTLTIFLLVVALLYILFELGLGSALEGLFRSLGLFMVLLASCWSSDEYEENSDTRPEDFLLTFGIGPVMIFAILAGVALLVSMPMFFAQAGGGAAEAFEAVGEAIKLLVKEMGFIAVYIMPALVAVLPIYVLQHKNKLSFIIFGAIYGLLITYILFQIGYIQVMAQAFGDMFGSWAEVPATIASTVSSGFVLRMIDEWIASLKKPRVVREREARS